jgi:hypothetical protein
MALRHGGLFFADTDTDTDADADADWRNAWSGRVVTADDPPLPIPPTPCPHRTERNCAAIAANMIRLGKQGTQVGVNGAT